MVTSDNKILVNEEKPQKHCFSYIRFSSKIQANGDSLRRQMEIAPRVAKEKGWVLRDDLCAQNLGVSAHKGANFETIKDIIGAAKAGKIPQGTVMIIEAFDRFSRTDVDIAEDMLKEALRAGLEIYVDRGGHHLTKESLRKITDRIYALLELAAANEYSEKLSERMGKAWRQKKARAADGVILTTMVPSWLDVDKINHKFVPNSHAPTIKRIFTNYANGKGIRTIMKELNREQIATLGKGNQNKSKGWSNSHIRRILEFRGVIGEYQPCRYVEGRKRIADGERIANYYPAIIEKPLFYKVQEMPERVMLNIKTGKKTYGHTAGRKGDVTNLFTGIVKCQCGSSMVIKQSGQRGKYSYTSLVCYNAMRGNGCKYSTIQYSSVERAILTMLFTKIIPAMAKTDIKQEKLTTLKGELKEAQKQKAKWVKIVNESDEVPEVAAKQLGLYETREKALERQIESLSATANYNPLVEWSNISNTPENRLRLQTILTNEIESLSVDALGRTAQVTFKNPQRTFKIKWPQSQGANATKVNLSMIGFECDGFNGPIPYLDELLVWKMENEPKLDGVMEMLKCHNEVKTAVHKCGAVALTA